jgi:hypothetical protein
MLLLSACAVAKTESEDTGSKAVQDGVRLKDIVYRDQDEDDYNYTVFIREDQIPEPYLVIDDSGDRILLLRKYLLDEEAPFLDEKSYGSNGGDYPESYVDG